MMLKNSFGGEPRQVGTGVAGDLFIHLLSGTHFITNSLGPETI